MNRLFVLKDVAYAAKTGGGTIAGAKELNALASGALALLNDRGELITATDDGAGNMIVDAPKLADSKTFAVAVGRKGGVQIISQIPRRDVYELNVKNYQAPVAMVLTVGGTTAAKALTFTDNEEAVIKVYDTSFSSRYNVQTINASIIKRASETPEQAVDRLVEKLNAVGSFVTAAKVGGGTANMGITLTPKNARTIISAALSGTFEYGNIETTTAQVYGDGVGADVLQLEKDFSVEEGNGNYIDYGGDHYKRQMEADENANYDLITMLWEGTHSSPSRTHNVMKNRVIVASIDGATNQESQAVLNYFTALIGKANDPVAGAEPAADDGTDNDGVAGN